MRAYHNIMEGLIWEGFKEDIHQHIRRCMDFLKMEERHNSLEELSQPLPFSLRMRGSPSMRYFTILFKVNGKGCVYVHHDSLTIYFYSLAIHVQVISLRGGTLSYSLHGLPGAISNDEDGHSLGDMGEMISYSGCAQFSPHIIHLLQACERTRAKRK